MDDFRKACLIQNAEAAISRRDAIRLAMASGLGLATVPAAGALPSAVVAEAFVPENDYPYFGFVPEEDR